jgi:hypothetical protein
VKPVLSPIALVVAVIGLVLGGLVGSSVIGMVVGAIVGWAVGAGIAALWRRTAPALPTARIDPFGVNEPWRRPVQDALQARNRFVAAIGPVRAGPLRDRLTEFAGRIDHGVEEIWRIARQGQSLAEARRRINPQTARAELDRIRAAGEPAPGSPADDTRAALESQLASAERVDRTITDTRERLRVLNARLDEAVAQAAELAVHADRTSELAELGAEIDDVVTDMEALRAAIEEVGGIGRPPELPGQPDTG